MTAHEIAGTTKVCRRHGQYIDTGRGCVVCDGEPRGPRYDSGKAGVRDRLQNRTHAEPERDDWEWV